jgi:putative transposase
MARPIRIEFAGASYHITARGNERRAIFKDDADRSMFVLTLAEATALHGLVVQAWCLMPNHYHLLIDTPRGNLSRGIGWLQTTYTIRFNRRWRRSGHLFQGRFKAHLVEADGYAQELLRYVHLNPVRPRDKGQPVPAERRESLARYRWSSHRAYAGAEAAPSWLAASWLAYFGQNRGEAQRGYRAFVQAAFGEVLEGPWERLRGALVLGSESFLTQVATRLGKKRGREEVKWRHREVDTRKRWERACALAAAEPDRMLQAWLRVIGGGEKRSEAARALGYADGSAITHMLRRAECRRESDETFASRIASYTQDLEQADS